VNHNTKSIFSTTLGPVSESCPQV